MASSSPEPVEVATHPTPNAERALWRLQLLQVGERLLDLRRELLPLGWRVDIRVAGLGYEVSIYKVCAPVQQDCITVEAAP